MLKSLVGKMAHHIMKSKGNKLRQLLSSRDFKILFECN